MKLTQRSVDNLKLPPKKEDHIEWDDDLPGFGVRLREGGSRVYIVQYKLGTKNRRMTLGSTKKLALIKARALAKDVLAKVNQGQDPQGEKAAARATASETFKAVAERFLEYQAERVRAGTYDDARRYLMVHAKPLHELRFDKIGRAEIASRLGIVAKNNGPVAADRMRATLSKLFSWGIKEGLCESNPAAATNKHAEDRSRDRVHDDKELATIWLALDDDDYGRIVKLLILTLCRREEIAGLRRSEVQGRTLDLPGERTKNGRALLVPLSDAAYRLIEERLHDGEDRDFIFGRRAGPFSGFSKAKHELDAKLKGMAPWRLHDLRRSAATGMAELGIEPHIIEACLNHVSGHKAGVAGIYNKAAYAKQKAEALNVWASHVVTIAAQATGTNVRKLRRRRVNG